MSLARALLLIVAGCIIDSVMASAEDLCPAGPFETDVGKITLAMAAEPLEPNLADAANATSDTREAAQLTDGAIWTASGGLGAHGQFTLEYDARRYIVRDIEEEWPVRDIFRVESRVPPEPPKPIPQQVIRKVAEVTTTTTIARPTPEQARTFACLANRLMAPPDQKSAAPSAERRDDSRSPAQITVRASPICTEVFTDAHVEGFSLLVSGDSVLMDNSDLSCAARYELRSQMKDTIYTPIKELIARGNAN